MQMRQKTVSGADYPFQCGLRQHQAVTNDAAFSTMVGEQRNTIALAVNTLAVHWTVITPQLPEQSGGCFHFKKEKLQ